MTITLTIHNAHISEGPGSVGTRVVDKDYPYEEGLSGAVTKQTGSPNL